MADETVRDSGDAGTKRSKKVRIMKGVAFLFCIALFLFLVLSANVPQLSADQCDCTFCHGANITQHGSGAGGCSGCHGFPPSDATHLKHAGAITSSSYGDISTTPDGATGYAFGCGNCHPLSNANHRNGTVDVELYNASSPAGSVKALNPSNAAYNPSTKTCSNVYCHSYNDWTTIGSVPMPWPQNAGDPAVPANTVTTRYYQTPTWGSTGLTCSGCHGNPPQTNYLTNSGGSGDSHSWLDDWGYADLHGWNMGSGWAVSCRTCHNDTVRDVSPFTYGTFTLGNITWYDVALYGNIPIYGYSKHVNGAVDIVFDKVNTLTYNTTPNPTILNLNSATYSSSTRTCSNVSCHLNQTSVTWGMPYRNWDSTECNRCHGM